ncbi:MAG: hypothetical protein U0821_09420 [Chloroflexota bacterium]
MRLACPRRLIWALVGSVAMLACGGPEERSATPTPLVATVAPTLVLQPVSTASAAPRPAPAPAPPAVPNKRGVHLLLDDGGTQFDPAVWEDHVRWARRLTGRGGHVVQLIRSDDLRPERWQRYFDLVARMELTPVVRLSTHKNLARQWWVAPPADPDGRYRQIASQYRKFVESITWRSPEVWVTVGNEPNRPDEWGGAPDPAAYARFLRDVAAELHAVNNVRVRVLNAALDAYAPSAEHPGGPSIDSDRFLEEMIAEDRGTLDVLDGWATHAYPLGPFGEHPSRQLMQIDDVRPNATARQDPPTGVWNRGINGYEWELWKLRQLGLKGTLPVYVTETGWRHRSSQTTGSLDRDHATVDDAALGELFRLAYDGPLDARAVGWTPWNHDERVVTAAVFALGGRADHWGHTNLLLLDAMGRIQGAYGFTASLAHIAPGSLALAVDDRPDGRD